MASGGRAILIWQIIGGVVLLSLGIMAWLAIRAPAGYEDERGFHLGKPPEARVRRKDEDEAA